MVSDDHGYADVGFQGCTDILTPHLDQFAKGELICINGPLRDGKGSVYDGEIRVTFVVSWSAKLPQGTTCTHPVISLNVVATALTAAGVAMPTDCIYDSINLIPYLNGENTNPPHDYLS